MKKLQISQITACSQCPFAAIGGLSVEGFAGTSIFFYCKREARSDSASSAIDMIKAVSSAVLSNHGLTIPNWCPLPNEENDRMQNVLRESLGDRRDWDGLNELESES